MSKTTFEYKEKHHILEVDGVEYEIPQRTAALEKKIREHDAVSGNMSEYEGNIKLLEILFGKEAAGNMFPDGDDTNLDKLARCTELAVALFTADYAELQKSKAKEKLKDVQPYLSAVNDLTKAANTAQLKNFVNGKKK